jgi:hypothetical protein
MPPRPLRASRRRCRSAGRRQRRVSGTTTGARSRWKTSGDVAHRRDHREDAVPREICARRTCSGRLISRLPGARVPDASSHTTPAQRLVRRRTCRRRWGHAGTRCSPPGPADQSPYELDLTLEAIGDEEPECGPSCPRISNRAEDRWQARRLADRASERGPPDRR